MKPTVATRVMLGFALVLALSVALGTYAVYKMTELRKIQTMVAERDVKALDLLRQVNDNQGDMRTLRTQILVQGFLNREKLAAQDVRATQAEWRRGAERTEKLLTELEALATEYEKVAANALRKEQWGKLRLNARDTRAAWRAQAAAIEPAFEQINRGELKEAAAQMDAAARLHQAYDAKLDDGIELTNQQIQIGSELSAATYEAARESLVIGLALLVVGGGGGAFLLQRSIARPLTAFGEFVGRVGQGDLTRQAAASSVGDIDRLGTSLNGMVGGLRDVAGQINASTQQLTAAAAEIMASIQQQGAGTTEQAATVQQITTTMEEITQSGAQISAKARQVAAGAGATSAAGASGTQAVQETTRTMTSIREQVEEVAENIVALSEKTSAVGEIIATVNDIAERSNLLALNAAIEAAAAGEQGNRFAVVAAEMKNLADQAKESTVQVRTILGDIQKGINGSVMLTEEAVKRVEAGKRQADVAEQTIRQMTRAVQESVSAFEQIIGAGGQQQIGLEQVAQGMKDIRQAAAQTAAAITQLESAVANLNGLGLELRKAAGRYRL